MTPKSYQLNSAPAMKVEPGTFWRYVGPGEGRGVRHKVLMAEPHEVITWSDGFNCAGGCGQSFLGDQQEFLACFSPDKS